MSFIIAEGYHVAKIERDDDCDHGPCTIYTLPNGDWFATYDRDPWRVSFHVESGGARYES